MKNIIYTTIIVATLFAYKLYAQGDIPDDLGYEPPDGWEYVMKLDSISWINLHCFNDSCRIRFEKRNYGILQYITTDGGKSWYDVENPQILAFQSWYMHNKNELHGIILKQEDDGYFSYYAKTTDFYTKREEYFIKQNGASYYNYQFIQSKLDPDVIIYTMKRGNYTDHFERYYFTHVIAFITYDGGKTWGNIELPKMPNDWTYYTFYEDISEAGRWFLQAENGYNIDVWENTQNNPRKFYITTDNFKSYKEINLDDRFARSALFNSSFDHPLIGIDGKNTFRHWSVHSSLSIYLNGISKYEYSDEITNSTYHNWLRIMDPTKPSTNLDSGYRNFLYNKLFHYDNSDYGYHLISRTEFDFTNIDSTRYSFLYQSTNLGKEWELLYFFENVRKPPYIYQSFLDQGTKTLWMYVYDDETLSANQIRKGSLWKLKLNWNSTDVEELPEKNKIIIYPNPANNNISIIIPEINNKVKINIMDLFGREIVDLYDNFANEHKLELKIPEYISSGTYFVKVVIGSDVIVEKIILIR